MALVSGAFFFGWTVGATSALALLAAAVSFLVLRNYRKWKEMKAIPEVRPWYPILGNSLLLDSDGEGKNFPPTSSKGSWVSRGGGGGSGYKLPRPAYSSQLVSAGEGGRLKQARNCWGKALGTETKVC